jgi:hypothetical protein
LSVIGQYSRNSNENIALAEVGKCIANTPQEKVIVYQSNNELDSYKKLNATGGSISSTFRYGGNPAFIYYAQKKKVDFVYFNIIDPVDTNTIRVYPKEKYPNLKFEKTNCDTSKYTVYLP